MGSFFSQSALIFNKHLNYIHQDSGQIPFFRESYQSLAYDHQTNLLFFNELPTLMRALQVLFSNCQCYQVYVGLLYVGIHVNPDDEQFCCCCHEPFKVTLKHLHFIVGSKHHNVLLCNAGLFVCHQQIFSTAMIKCRSLTIEQVQVWVVDQVLGYLNQRFKLFLLKLNLKMDCEITSSLKLKPKPGLSELLSVLKIGTCS